MYLKRIYIQTQNFSHKNLSLCGRGDRRPRGVICLILSLSQNCCHSHCVNKSMARVKCEKQEINYAPCGTTPPRKQQTQGPTKSCTLPCCQKEQLPRWTPHPWLARPGLGPSAISALRWGQGQGPPVHLALIKQEPGGCWTFLQHH